MKYKAENIDESNSSLLIYWMKTCCAFQLSKETRFEVCKSKDCVFGSSWSKIIELLGSIEEEVYAIDEKFLHINCWDD